MTCKDCIHSEICLEQYSQLNPDMMFSECKKFKNKADFVEVVRCDNCYLQGHCIVEDTFNTARMADSMKFCAVGKRKKNDFKE